LGARVNRLRALGALDLRDETGRELRTLLAQPKRVALLVYLSTATPRSFHRRDSLVALLWPELDTEHARNALRQALHFLRQGLGTATVAARGVEELAIAPEHLAVDVVEFENALEAGDLERALELYRGDLLPGFFISEAPVFERWLDERRTSLRNRAAAAAWQLSTRAEAAGDRVAAIQWARRGMLLAIDDEAGVRRLLELHLRLGDRRGALRAYEDFAAQLRKEFEVEPSAETQVLIAGARAPVAPPAVPAPLEGDRVPPAAGVVGAAARPRRWTAVQLTATAAAIVLLVTVSISMASRRADVPDSAARAIAVLPFPVRGRPELGYLREGMVDLVSAKLDGVLGLRSVDPRAVLAAVQQGPESESAVAPAQAASVARELGAEYFVLGDVVEIAGRVNLNGALYRGSRRLSGASAAGESTNLFQLVDDLTGQLLVPLSGGRDTALTRLAAVTTHSLPALKAYLDGERALRMGNEAQAGASFRTAAILDTGFALAQYRLALTATWVPLADAADPSEWADRAARHAANLTPLGRDLLAAYRAYKALDAELAENGYRAITDAHPDNVEAWLMLGETRFHYIPFAGRSPTESREPFRRALALDPGNPHALLHLARLAAREGQSAELESAVGEYLTRYSTAERSLEMRALRTFVRNDSAGYAALAQNTGGAYTLSSMLQDAIWYSQDLAAARWLTPSVTAASSTPVARWVNKTMLTDLGLMGGRWGMDALAGLPGGAINPDWLLESEALAAAEPFFAAESARILALRESLTRQRPYRARVVAWWPETKPMGPLMQAYLVGLLSIRLNDSVAVNRSAALLKEGESGPVASVAAALSRGLRAELARSRGDWRAVLSELDDFPFGAPSPARNIAHWGVRERFLRAEALHAVGRDAEALQWYESFPAGYDGPFIAPAHFRRAEIQGRLGNTERARFHAGRFISLWADCDPILRGRITTMRTVLNR